MTRLTTNTLSALPATRMVAHSRWHDSVALTPAGPDPSKPGYLNGVALIDTALAPTHLLHHLLRIEREHGRKADEAEIAERMGLDLDAFHERVQAVQGSHPLHLEDFGPRSDDGSPVVGCDDWLQDPNSPDAFEETARAERRKQLEDAIASLPEQQSRVLFFYYFEGLKMREIGQALGVTESRVCQVHARAVARLRKQLAGSFGDF